ncbi:MAG: molybdate ABC transporter substrate-binding protein, partial [Azoarcus sp.]|nr:molybdate ABC transporter substrate-binding protein [Azoarcus sp.]
MKTSASKSKILVLIPVLSFALAHAAWAGEVTVAVAANFTAPMQALAAGFERETGYKA